MSPQQIGETTATPSFSPQQKGFREICDQIEAADAAESVPLSAVAARLRVVFVLLLRRSRQQDSAGRLSPSQLSVMGRLDRFETMTATELAQAGALRPQTIRNLIDELRDEGLIVGVRDTDDARRVNLMLTGEGRAMVRGTRGQDDPFLLDALREKLTESQRRKVIDVLEILENIAYS
ncbi:MarR family winged helix-turn-helix transcriptional regulator [Nocardia xishanensis]|uniref:MarR family winged helix-turn-helix transcriptional regulator n=1 Tax=Nocardia xishanensis TaxID=238964 RepID=UPI0034472745